MRPSTSSGASGSAAAASSSSGVLSASVAMPAEAAPPPPPARVESAAVAAAGPAQPATLFFPSGRASSVAARVRLAMQAAEEDPRKGISAGVVDATGTSADGEALHQFRRDLAARQREEAAAQARSLVQRQEDRWRLRDRPTAQQGPSSMGWRPEEVEARVRAFHLDARWRLSPTKLHHSQAIHTPVMEVLDSHLPPTTYRATPDARPVKEPRPVAHDIQRTLEHTNTRINGEHAQNEWRREVGEEVRPTTSTTSTVGDQPAASAAQSPLVYTTDDRALLPTSRSRFQGELVVKESWERPPSGLATMLQEDKAHQREIAHQRQTSNQMDLLAVQQLKAARPGTAPTQRTHGQNQDRPTSAATTAVRSTATSATAAAGGGSSSLLAKLNAVHQQLNRSSRASSTSSSNHNHNSHHTATTVLTMGLGSQNHAQHHQQQQHHRQASESSLRSSVSSSSVTLPVASSKLVDAYAAATPTALAGLEELGGGATSLSDWLQLLGFGKLKDLHGLVVKHVQEARRRQEEEAAPGEDDAPTSLLQVKSTVSADEWTEYLQRVRDLTSKQLSQHLVHAIAATLHAHQAKAEQHEAHLNSLLTMDPQANRVRAVNAWRIRLRADLDVQGGGGRFGAKVFHRLRSILGVPGPQVTLAEVETFLRANQQAGSGAATARIRPASAFAASTTKAAAAAAAAASSTRPHRQFLGRHGRVVEKTLPQPSSPSPAPAPSSSLQLLPPPTTKTKTALHRPISAPAGPAPRGTHQRLDSNDSTGHHSIDGGGGGGGGAAADPSGVSSASLQPSALTSRPGGRPTSAVAAQPRRGSQAKTRPATARPARATPRPMLSSSAVATMLSPRVGSAGLSAIRPVSAATPGVVSSSSSLPSKDGGRPLPLLADDATTEPRPYDGLLSPARPSDLLATLNTLAVEPREAADLDANLYRRPNPATVRAMRRIEENRAEEKQQLARHADQMRGHARQVARQLDSRRTQLKAFDVQLAHEREEALAQLESERLQRQLLFDQLDAEYAERVEPEVELFQQRVCVEEEHFQVHFPRTMWGGGEDAAGGEGGPGGCADGTVDEQYEETRTTVQHVSASEEETRSIQYPLTSRPSSAFAPANASRPSTASSTFGPAGMPAAAAAGVSTRPSTASSAIYARLFSAVSTMTTTTTAAAAAGAGAGAATTTRPSTAVRSSPVPLVASRPMSARAMMPHTVATRLVDETEGQLPYSDLSTTESSVFPSFREVRFRLRSVLLPNMISPSVPVQQYHELPCALEPSRCTVELADLHLKVSSWGKSLPHQMGIDGVLDEYFDYATVVEPAAGHAMDPSAASSTLVPPTSFNLAPHPLPSLRLDFSLVRRVVSDQFKRELLLDQIHRGAEKIFLRDQRREQEERRIQLADLHAKARAAARLAQEAAGRQTGVLSPRSVARALVSPRHSDSSGSGGGDGGGVPDRFARSTAEHLASVQAAAIAAERFTSTHGDWIRTDGAITEKFVKKCRRRSVLHGGDDEQGPVNQDELRRRSRGEDISEEEYDTDEGMPTPETEEDDEEAAAATTLASRSRKSELEMDLSGALAFPSSTHDAYLSSGIHANAHTGDDRGGGDLDAWLRERRENELIDSVLPASALATKPRRGPSLGTDRAYHAPEVNRQKHQWPDDEPPRSLVDYITAFHTRLHRDLAQPDTRQALMAVQQSFSSLEAQARLGVVDSSEVTTAGGGEGGGGGGGDGGGSRQVHRIPTAMDQRFARRHANHRKKDPSAQPPPSEWTAEEADRVRESLQSRLLSMWTMLELTSRDMLVMLDKYSQPAHVPMLEGALDAWETCARLWQRRQQLLDQVRTAAVNAPALTNVHNTGGTDGHSLLLTVISQAAHACRSLFVSHGDSIQIAGHPMILRLLSDVDLACCPQAARVAEEVTSTYEDMLVRRMEEERRMMGEGSAANTKATTAAEAKENETPSGIDRADQRSEADASSKRDRSPPQHIRHHSSSSSAPFVKPPPPPPPSGVLLHPRPVIPGEFMTLLRGASVLKLPNEREGEKALITQETLATGERNRPTSATATAAAPKAQSQSPASSHLLKRAPLRPTSGAIKRAAGTHLAASASQFQQMVNNKQYKLF